MKKRNLMILSSLIGLAVLAGLVFYSNQADRRSDMTQGLGAITSVMGRHGSGNRNDSADAREGTSADTVATPSDFPSAYDYGTGHIDGYSREDMLRKMSEPSGNQTVMNTASDTGNIQALYLWEEGNVPAQTDFTSSMMGCFDDSDFRPYVTAIPVEQGVTPKGSVVLMAGGAYQFRGNYTDALPTAAALREEGFQTFIVNYRLRPYTPLYALIRRRREPWTWRVWFALSVSMPLIMGSRKMLLL